MRRDECGGVRERKEKRSKRERRGGRKRGREGIGKREWGEI